MPDVEYSLHGAYGVPTYEFVSWDYMLFPTEWKHQKHVPNHQPVMENRKKLKGSSVPTSPSAFLF